MSFSTYNSMELAARQIIYCINHNLPMHELICDIEGLKFTLIFQKSRQIYPTKYPEVIPHRISIAPQDPRVQNIIETYFQIDQSETDFYYLQGASGCIHLRYKKDEKNLKQDIEIENALHDRLARPQKKRGQQHKCTIL